MIQNPHQNNLLGIVMMLLHVIALSALYAMVKYLVKDIDSSIAVFMYKLAILIMVFPLCISKGIKSMYTDKLGIHFIRAFFSICGSLSMFYAIKHISLADISAVQYLEHIVMMIIGIIFFHEQPTKTKFGVIIVSLLGAIFVIRQDLIHAIVQMDSSLIKSNGFNSYYIFVFMALGFWAMNNVMVKILGRTEKTNNQVFYTTLFSCLLSWPVAFAKWHIVYEFMGLEIKVPYEMMTLAETHLTTEHIWPLSFLGILYFIHSITHFKALKHAELSVVVPLEYTRLLFAAILGYIFFHEIPNGLNYIGYLLITGAGLYLVKYEHKKYRRRKKLQEAAIDAING